MTVGNRRRQPSLAQLRAFAAVAEHLHFRDAAGAIGMSQPALSGAVSALEETLGVILVERTTRKVLLSPAGERLAVRAKAVLAEVGALMEEADALRAPFTGALRLGVIPTVAPYLLPTVLRLVHDRYPHLDLQVHEEQTANLLDGLAGGGWICCCSLCRWGCRGSPNCRSSTRTSSWSLRSGMSSGAGGGASGGVAGAESVVARRGALPAGPGAGHLPRGGAGGRAGDDHGGGVVDAGAVGRRWAGGDVAAADGGAGGDVPVRGVADGVVRRAGAEPAGRAGDADGGGAGEEYAELAVALRESMRELPVRTVG
ncbi:hypothetical protein SHKM778_13470 [Streptomyces sp. KM77-8]|uniref:HTH lysR-type domain-containing protein n=1 Tax=Streptomyces haneummycinicus TaxID=3074435 RepID=A0AAT9HC51_9ACTN